MKPAIKAILSCALALGFTHIAHAADDLDDYVGFCQEQLGFGDLPDLNCNDGDLFAPNKGAPDQTNDYMGYYKVNNDVDLVFACRWLTHDIEAPSQGFQASRSIELQVHNRETGGTCFFSAIEGEIDIVDEMGNVVTTQINRASTKIRSITAPDAASYWRQPEEMNAEVQCVGCHAAGTYIASPRIAPFLSKYGLLNNGHDTLNMFASGSLENMPRRFHAVAAEPGSLFHAWNDRINDDNVVDTNTCASGCHSYVRPEQSPPARCESSTCGGDVIIPSIAMDYASIISANVMEPRQQHSPYRWINYDSVDEGSDQETYTNASREYSYLMDSCNNPEVLEARVVGSDYTFSTADVFQDKLEFFNLRDGLRCIDGNQSDGQCNDYETRYLCPRRSLGEPNYWTHDWAETWYDVDDPAPTMDDESRAALASAGVNICDGDEPLAIQARTADKDGFSAFGPNDRLNKFDEDGLICRNEDQPDGAQCSNYVVRYKNCDGQAFPTSDFYEIVIRAKDRNDLENTLNVYVNDFSLTQFDRAVAVDTQWKEYIFRTNATGVLTILRTGNVDIDYVAVNGSVRQAQGEIESGSPDSILVRARGTSGSEQIRVTVGGFEVDRFTLSTSWAEYPVYTNLLGGVNVEFLNDANNRDVDLDWVRFNGVTRQAENQSYNTATYANGSCGGGTGNMMHCNGIIGFGDYIGSNYVASGESYGYLSSKPMPNVVTIVDVYDDWNNGYCANVIAQNTTNVTQNISFNFELTNSDIYTTWNFTHFPNTGVISGSPEWYMPKTLLPNQTNPFGNFGFCANK